MEASKEHRLNYCFEIPSITKFDSGDSISSSCPLGDTLQKGQSYVLSSAGLPLHFTLHLIITKRRPENMALLFQLRLQLPNDIPFFPPVTIKPVHLILPGIPCNGPNWLNQRHVGPEDPASWAFTMSYNMLSWDEKSPVSYQMKGKFIFKLVNEPVDPLPNLPPSKTHWSSLPDEMVSAVLRELPLADRVKARLVCRSWARLLDTDALAWNNISFLESLSSRMKREEPGGYHGGRLNQVQGDRISSALHFLTARKAPIRALELNTFTHLHFHFAQNEMEKFANLFSHIYYKRLELKSLAVRSNCSGITYNSQLIWLIKSQSTLENLYIEKLSSVVRLPSLLPALPKLRILSLNRFPTDELRVLGEQLPNLVNLIGLRLVIYSQNLWALTESDVAAISVFSEACQRHQLALRPVLGAMRPDIGLRGICGCKCLDNGVMLVWGTEELSPATAAFLIVPYHMNDENQFVSHYRI